MLTVMIQFCAQGAYLLWLPTGRALIVGRVLILFLRMTKALAKTARSSQMILFQVLKPTKQASLNN